MEKLLREFVNKSKNKRLNIIVIGDSMIDEYYDTEVSRISPEFPIPVNKSSTTEPIKKLPGGAANVAAQFKHWNVDVRLASFVDQDCIDVFTGFHEVFTGFNTSLCQYIEPWKIPKKRRFYQGDFPLFRWDIEQENYGLNHNERRSLEKKLYDKIPQGEIMIFSDYGKGVFGTAPWMDLEGYKAVDPKKHLLMWRGCDLFKPNAIEARNMSILGYKTASLDRVGSHLQEVLEGADVVITDGGNGFVSLGDQVCCPYENTIKVDAQSVIGAGDSFIVFLTMARNLGFDLKESAKIAYQAGAIYVQRKHNKPLHPLDLLSSVEPEDLADRDFKLVLTNGCYDVLHSGHLQTLKFAKEKGDKLVVALNSDESIRRLKGWDRPIKPLEERMRVLEALEMVDFVISFEEDTPLEVIHKIKPDILVKGAQYGDGEIVGEGFVKETFRAPMVEGLSTTNLLEGKNE